MPSSSYDFIRALLADVRALEYLLVNNKFEADVMRIGAEQELCLVDSYGRPSLCNLEVLARVNKPWLTTELGRFNLECNLTPLVFEGNSLGTMHRELEHCIQTIREASRPFNTDVLLTGILPTLKKSDLAMANLTPVPRYKMLMEALSRQRRAHYELRLEGIDELMINHDSPLLEACNTSFQVHLQVHPSEFVKRYNHAQAITGPVLSIAANSPLLFGKRLWHETRIALFQQSIDNRKSKDHLRQMPARVSFGSNWLEHSIIELYRDNISRFPPLLHLEQPTNSIEELRQGVTPSLSALQMHNSTVYLWNRPCYGISPNGQPHLRIENRVLPSGPTLQDQMANMTFWLGLMEGINQEYPDIKQSMSFEDAHDNFFKAARYGLDSKFTWLNNRKISAIDLISKELLPLAKQGLLSRCIDKKDADFYLGIIEDRAKQHCTGARWMLRSFSQLTKQTHVNEALNIITHHLMDNQFSGKPIHEWELAQLNEGRAYSNKLSAQDIMATDVFTALPDTPIELINETMDWRKQRYGVVEDEHGVFMGLITARILLQHFTKQTIENNNIHLTIEEIMLKKEGVISVEPNALVLDVIKLMTSHNIGCIPVTQNNELLGLITEKSFLEVSKNLLKRP